MREVCRILERLSFEQLPNGQTETALYFEWKFGMRKTKIEKRKAKELK